MKYLIAVAVLTLVSCAALRTNGAKVCEQLDTAHASLEDAYRSAKTTCEVNGLPTSKED